MKRFQVAIFSCVLALALFVHSCSTVPVTGRKQLSIIPSSQMLSMSYQQYDDFLKASKPSTDQEQVTLVRRVGARIQGAVEEFFRRQNMSERLKDYRWEFNLVESDQVNAWCMPGGKVVVYTGILPVTQTETGLAVVMGHEIAHAIAEHGKERMSQGLLAQMGGMALDQALSNKPEQTKQLWLRVFGVGVQVGVKVDTPTGVTVGVSVGVAVGAPVAVAVAIAVAVAVAIAVE